MTAFHVAEYYELLGNRGGRLEREGPFLLEALASSPAGPVLDLASGLGLHALFLAEHGAQVTACDLSPEMTGHARLRRPHENITYAVGDMRFPAGGPYGMALCLGNSLSLLVQEEDLCRFFHGVSSVLLPGGQLILQTLNYDALTMKKPRIRVEQESAAGTQLVAVKSFMPDGNQTRLAITYFEATEKDLREHRETALLRHWSKETLLETALEAGLKITQAWGTFLKSPLKPDSPDILLVFHKSG